MSEKIKYPVHISKKKKKTYPFPEKSKRKEEVPSFPNALARFTIVSFSLNREKIQYTQIIFYFFSCFCKGKKSNLRADNLCGTKTMA